MVAPSESLLTPRWYPLRAHAPTEAIWRRKTRFIVAAAGRRSGKTERCKRLLVREALRFSKASNGKFIACAPTRDQAKEIYWDDLKALVPDWAVRARGIVETELSIRLVSGTKIQVLGMDKPHRAEGSAIDGIVLDEYADMKAEVFTRSVRPALDTDGRNGWAIFIGKSKGRNHFWRIFREAATLKDWSRYSWPSSDVLSPEAILDAKRDLDEITFKREYEATFLDFEGRAYYPYDEAVHLERGLREAYYDKRQSLDFCFDFNVEPGVAAVAQTINHKMHGPDTDAWIGEVWIPKNSNTPAVCRKLIADWGTHEGLVWVYGDATGGARGTARVDGSDWDLVEKLLRAQFGGRLRMSVEKANPLERVRINALNSKLRNAAGEIKTAVDGCHCPQIDLDLQGTTLLKGGSGELDKDHDPERTHMTDGMGYRAATLEKKRRNQATFTPF